MDKKRADSQFYRLGKWIWIPLMIWGCIFTYCIYGDYIEGKLNCMFLKTTGLPCPGCGGTRSVVYLFQGKIFKSLICNPTVIFAVFEYIHFMALYFWRYHISKNIEIKKIRVDYYVYVLIGVIIIQWITKIILILI